MHFVSHRVHSVLSHSRVHFSGRPFAVHESARCYVRDALAWVDDFVTVTLGRSAGWIRRQDAGESPISVVTRTELLHYPNIAVPEYDSLDKGSRSRAGQIGAVLSTFCIPHLRA